MQQHKNKNDHLLMDTDSEVLINLPSGKISKKEQRISLHAQKGDTCLLYSMRRIAFFNNPDVKDSHLYQAFRHVKNAIKNLKGDYESLLTTFKEVCHQLNINVDRVMTTSKAYSKECMALPNIQCSLLYEAIITQRLYPLFNIKNSTWHPRDGFNGLKNALKKHGAHVFIGKFGYWCHSGENGICYFPKESTEKREVYAFTKGSYQGDSIQGSHAVVVDQVKIVDCKEMVFFRDPNTASNVDQKEKIFMISYVNFIQRLTNKQSHLYAKNECLYENHFGIISSNPSKLLEFK